MMNHDVTISIPKIKKSCEEVCCLLKALSHPQRLLIMVHLLKGPKTVSDLVDLCGISQSQMSQFLTRMRIEQLVKVERSGKYRVYSIQDRRLVPVLKIIQSEYCRG